MSDRWLWSLPAIGLLLLMLAVGNQLHRIGELDRMRPVAGVVTDLERDGCPIIRFRTSRGEQRRVPATVCSLGSYMVGQRVALYYDPADTNAVRVDSFVDNWFASLALSGIGLPLLVVGGLLLGNGTETSPRGKRLLRHGRPVSARLIAVRRNPSSTLNNVQAWQLVLQWHDVQTGYVRLFHSEDLWLDPKPFLKGDEMTVLIDPADPRQYWVDTRHLPSLTGVHG